MNGRLKRRRTENALMEMYVVAFITWNRETERINRVDQEDSVQKCESEPKINWVFIFSLRKIQPETEFRLVFQIQQNFVSLGRFLLWNKPLGIHLIKWKCNNSLWKMLNLRTALEAEWHWKRPTSDRYNARHYKKINRKKHTK